MTTAHRYRPLFLLLGAVLTLAVTAGFLVLRYAPSNTGTLPIEVIGPDGYTESVTIVASDGAQAQDLYLQAHSIGYPYYEDFTVSKASIRINGGPWTDITNDIATCQFPESNLDCVGGPYPTIRFEIPVADIGGSLQDGSNTIDFRFNYAFPADSPDDFGSPSTGYRILDLELRDGADVDLIDGTTFAWDDPSTWAPPEGYDDPQSISDGEALWHDRDILVEGWGGHDIRASCADCHAADGRDLQYFAFSNTSIVARSAFHGLTDDDGKKIAAYIRSQELQDVDDGHTYAPPARPWTPVYQPGPTNRASRGEDAPRDQGTAVENMPSNGSQYWAAGGGLEWALGHDEETVPYLFPNGVSKELFYPENSLRMEEIPAGIQFPDWNEWLPVHHPLDIWGNDWIGSDSWKAYYGESGQKARYSSFIACWEANGNNGECIDEAQRFMGRIFKKSNFFGRVTHPDPRPEYSDLTDENEFAFRRVNLMKWTAAKQWEVMHTYDLADENAYATEGDDLNWLTGIDTKHRAVFNHAPHIVGQYAGSKQRTWDLWLDTGWYEVNTRINHGRGAGITLKPNDWKYHFAHIGGFQQSSGGSKSSGGVAQVARFWTSQVKVMQNCDTFDRNRGEPKAWYVRTGHCGIGTPFKHGRTTALDNYQPGLADQVMEAFTRYIVERMMYQYSPVTYDQQTGSFSGDVDANWSRETGKNGWEPETVKPSLDDPYHKTQYTPGHYLRALDQMANRSISPTLLDSAAVWLNAMNPDPQWDSYRCQENGGALSCSLSMIQDIQLHSGWNLVSGHVGPDDPALESIFSDISEDILLVKDGGGNVYLPGDNINTIGSWYPLEGYLVYSTSDHTLTLEGTIHAPEEHPLSLKQGWNIVSYLPQESLPVDEALSSIAEYIELVKDESGDSYIPGYGINDIGDMSPGEGYKIYVTEPVDLTYPAPAPQ